MGTITEEIVKQVTEKYVDLALGGKVQINFEKAIELAKVIYEKAKSSYPDATFPGRERVYFASSMMAAQSLANRLARKPVDWATIDAVYGDADRQASYWTNETCRPDDNYLSYSCIGLAHTNWAAVVDAYEIANLPMEQEYKDLRTLLVESGVYDCIVFDGAIIFIPPPAEVHRDSEGRLHCTTGPALRELQGEEFYFIHGIDVPKRWVTEPESITAQEIITQDNVELRRILLELKGLENFMKEADAQVLDEGVDDTGEPCRLLKVRQPEDEDLVVYHWRCPSSKKEGFLRVNPRITTCKEAAPATFPTARKYAPEAAT